MNLNSLKIQPYSTVLGGNPLADWPWVAQERQQQWPPWWAGLGTYYAAGHVPPRQWESSLALAAPKGQRGAALFPGYWCPLLV